MGHKIQTKTNNWEPDSIFVAVCVYAYVNRQFVANLNSTHGSCDADVHHNSCDDKVTEDRH